MGLAGWTVIVKNSRGVEVGRNTTEKDGSWIVCGLEPGSYYVEEVVQPGWNNVTSLNQSVVLGCNSATGIVFRNEPLLCISGYKLNAAENKGLEGWTIHLNDSQNQLIASTTTNDSGKYQFCNLVPGTYNVSEVMQAGWMPVGPTYHEVDLSCTNADNQDFTNTRLLCISGKKLDANGDKPLAGWTIFIDRNNNGKLDPVEQSVTTDSRGSYEFCYLAPGTYNVSEVIQPGWMPVSPTCRNVILSSGNASLVDFVNTRLLCIEGRKTDKSGNGLPNWGITLTKRSGQEVATIKTNATGYYKFCDLAPGNYKVCETPKIGWMPVGDTCHDVTLSYANASGVDFVNTRMCISG
jgi:uncharacterized surface anchored protein